MIPEETTQKAREEFVHGYLDENGERVFPSLASLASRHSVSQSAIYEKAKRDDWQGQKNRYQSELQARVDQDRMTRMVEDARRLDESCIQISQAMLGSVGRKLQKSIEQERMDPEYIGIDASTLNQLSVVTANAQKIGKLALGQAQEIQQVAADVSNPEAFREIMEQLDELASSRAQRFEPPLH